MKDLVGCLHLLSLAALLSRRYMIWPFQVRQDDLSNHGFVLPLDL